MMLRTYVIRGCVCGSRPLHLGVSIFRVGPKKTRTRPEKTGPNPNPNFSGRVSVHAFAYNRFRSGFHFFRVKTEKTEEEYISANVANLVGELMRNNVVEKYGDNRFSGLSMCGKTGTAEVGDDAEPHSWFVGFSQKPSCPVAIVVVVENGGWGSQEALPVASTVMNSIYKSLS